jgi:hypothetical protein
MRPSQGQSYAQAFDVMLQALELPLQRDIKVRVSCRIFVKMFQSASPASHVSETIEAIQNGV